MKLQFTFIDEAEPKLKIITFLSFIIVVVSLPKNSWLPFLISACYLFFTVIFSSVTFFSIIKRFLITLPFIGTIAVFMLLFTKGGKEYEILGITIFEKGIFLFLTFLIRVTLAVFAVYILTSSTSFRNLMAGLHALGVPFVFISMLEFTWRYLFVFKSEIINIRKAADSRGYGVKWIWQAKTLGKIAGSLFIRSFVKGEMIYNSMISRGYSKNSSDNMKKYLKNKNNFKFSSLIFMIFSITLFVFIGFLGFKGSYELY